MAAKPADEVEVGMARFIPRYDEPEPQSCVVVVGGPDRDGEILLLAGAETYLPREVARALANEILRRLAASEEE